MKTVLLLWNPDDPFSWDTLDEDYRSFQRGEPLNLSWASGTRKSFDQGDRIFLIRLGSSGTRGICASGEVTRPGVEYDKHWNGSARKRAYVRFRVDRLLHPGRDTLLEPWASADRDVKGYKWNPQGGGVRIPEPVASKLEAAWKAHSSGSGSTVGTDASQASQDDSRPAGKNVRESPDGDAFIMETERELPEEGRRRLVTHMRAERRPEVRKAVLARHSPPYRCKACDFSFDAYGADYGKYIQVHHNKPLGAAAGARKPDAADFSLLCANCHAVAHWKDALRPLEVEEITALLNKPASQPANSQVVFLFEPQAGTDGSRLAYTTTFCALSNAMRDAPIDGGAAIIRTGNILRESSVRELAAIHGAALEVYAIAIEGPAPWLAAAMKNWPDLKPRHCVGAGLAKHANLVELPMRAAFRSGKFYVDEGEIFQEMRALVSRAAWKWTPVNLGLAQTDPELGDDLFTRLEVLADIGPRS